MGSSASAKSIESSDDTSHSDTSSDMGSSAPATSRSACPSNLFVSSQEPMLAPLIYHSDDSSVRLSLLTPSKPRPKCPPTLNYRGLQLVNSTRLLPSGFGKRFCLNGISADGELFVLLTKTKFAILTKSSLICTEEIQDNSPGLVGTNSRKQSGSDYKLRRSFGVAYLQKLQIRSSQLKPSSGRNASIFTTTPDSRLTETRLQPTHLIPQRQSELRFLQKSDQRWIQPRHPLLVTIISEDPETQIGDKAITVVAMDDPISILSK